MHKFLTKEGCEPPPNNFGDSVDEGGEVKFNNPQVKVSSNYVLDKRSKEGLGTEKGKIGSVWKGNETGKIYRDNFFYVEPHFGWLAGISGTEKIKSKVSGIGWKVISNKGDPIIAGESGIAWGELRKDPSWISNTQEELKKEKTIRIQQVPYYETEKDGIKHTVDLSENTCIVNVGNRVNGKGVDAYLIIGFAQGSGEKEDKKGYRLSWKNIKDDFLVKGYSCKSLSSWFNNGVSLGLDWSWASDNGSWSALEDSMVVLKSGGGIIYVNGDGVKPVVPIVLGLVVNKLTAEWQYKADDDWREKYGKIKWDKVLSNKEEDWKNRSWGNGKKSCFVEKETGVKGEMTETCLKDKKRLDAFTKRVGNITLTYSYKLNQ